MASATDGQREPDNRVGAGRGRRGRVNPAADADGKEIPSAIRAAAWGVLFFHVLAKKRLKAGLGCSLAAAARSHLLLVLRG